MKASTKLMEECKFVLSKYALSRAQGGTLGDMEGKRAVSALEI
jgi:hypothetical protein